MAAAAELSQPPQVLLDSLFGPLTNLSGLSLFTGDDDVKIPTPALSDNLKSRPYVTLTFAQSLDAKIAGKGGKQLILSGKESLIMTHWMRTMHDAIMVGIGTAMNDDPQLNTRHVPPLPAGHPYIRHIPRPVILDTNLRLPTGCKLLRNFKAGSGRRPWVVTSPSQPEQEAWTERRAALEEAGARVLEVRSENGRISIPLLLGKLRELGIRSLMVEGGARVIQSFLAESQSAGAADISSQVVDTIIVTVAPTIVGDEGVGYGTSISSASVHGLQHSHSALFGHDVVFSMKFFG